MSGAMLMKSIWLVLAVAVPVTLALAGAGAGAAAAGRLDSLDIGPKVGAAIAPSLGARDQNGTYRDIRSLARKRGLILLFSRSLDW